MLSNNLLLCQYWGMKETTIHYRSPIEFFNEILKDDRPTIEDMDDYIDNEDDDPLNKTLFQAQRKLQQMKPIPDWWHLIYKEDPIFSIMYPRTKVEKTEWALTCDLHNWGNIIERDYSIYKYYKSFLNKMIYKFKKQAKLVKSKTKKVNLPKYLEIEEIVEELDRASEIKTTNISYNKIVSTFFKYDIKGYKSDKNYNSMIDDSLHTYYASLCDYFITLDERCNAKAKKTYEDLKLNTQVLTPIEFNDHINTL